MSNIFRSGLRCMCTKSVKQKNIAGIIVVYLKHCKQQATVICVATAYFIEASIVELFCSFKVHF